MNKTSIIKILFLVIFGLLGLGQLQKIMVTPTVQIYIHEIVVACLIILTTPELIQRLCDKKRRPPLMLPLLFTAYLLLITLVQFFWIPAAQVMIGLAYWLRLVLYEIFALCLMVLMKQGLLKKKEILLLIMFTTSLITMFGLLQFFIIPDLRILRFGGWDDHYLRLVSTLLDPAFTGAMLFLGLVTFIHNTVMPISLTKRFLFLGTTALAILLTYSRATYTVALSWGVVLAWHKPSIRKILFWFVIIGCVAVLLLPRPASEGARLERFTSIQARISNTIYTIQSLKPHEWLFGSGWYIAQSGRRINNTITTISHSSSPDNSFLHILQSSGLIGLFISMLCLYAIWKNVTVYGKATLFAVCVASLFSQVLFYPFVMALLPSILFLQNCETRKKKI